MDNRINELKSLIERSQSEIKGLSSSLGIHHSFHFDQCIERDALSSLEDEYSVKLPVQYREFVTSIGNGGGQPLNGMFTVEQSLSIFRRKILSGVKDPFADELFADCWFSEVDEGMSINPLMPEGEEQQTVDGNCVLTFAYLPETRLHCAVLMEGEEKDAVIYYSDSIERKVKYTDKTFLDWWIGYYEHILKNLPVYGYISL